MSTLPAPSGEPGPVITSQDPNQLAARVAALEQRLPENSWLFGNSFLKRVFAIWGHYIIAQLIIALVVGGLFLMCFLVFGGLLAGLSRR